MGLDGSIIPYILPELGGLRDTPLPEIIVSGHGQAMLGIGGLNEVVNLGTARARVSP